MTLRPVFLPGRLIAVAFVSLILAPTYVGDQEYPPANWSARYTLSRLHHEAQPQDGVSLEGVWHLASPDRRLGSYSALVSLPRGRLKAYADTRWWLSFRRPDAAGNAALRFGYNAVPDPDMAVDVESAARDPESGTIWLGVERTNQILRFDPSGRFKGGVAPPEMADFKINGGAEAMTRLPDGRFLVIAESSSWLRPLGRDALLFPRDPVLGDRPVQFEFRPPLGFDPTDVAALPDGRVLILLRAVAPSFHGLFASRILLADPRTIKPGQPWSWRELVDVNALAPAENYEGMAVVPEKAGATIWLISDANKAVRVQRTLIVKLFWKG